MNQEHIVNANKMAVNWLVSQVEDHIGLIPVDIIEKARQMEKEQIMSAWLAGFEETRPYVDHSEDYYKETYESNTL